jgi:hypothetical protein
MYRSLIILLSIGLTTIEVAITILAYIGDLWLDCTCWGDAKVFFKSLYDRDA